MILEDNFAQRKKGYPQGSLFFVFNLFRSGLTQGVVLSGIAAAVSCTTAPKTEDPIVLQGEAQGTTFAITYWPVSETPASERVADSIQLYLVAFNEVASAWDTGSVISRWNRGMDFDQDEPAEWNRLLQEGQRIKNLTNGWMDPEVGRFTSAWGFNGQKAVLGTGNPSADSARIRELMGLTKPCYDVNAFAQGLSVDGVAQILKHFGVAHALVEIGGELYALGGRPDGSDFQVAVDAPTEVRKGKPITVVGLKNRGMATSGNYRKFQVDPKSGMRYGHTLNPFTGWTARTDLLSATVLAPSSSEADGVATALMAMGLNQAKELVLKHPEWDVVLVYSNPSGAWEVYSTLE